MVSYTDVTQASVKRTLQAAANQIAAGRLDAAKGTLESNKAAMRLPVAWNMLGQVHLRQGHPSDALSAFDRAVRMMPRLPEAHANRGVALLQMGHAAEALAALEQALRLRPGLPLVRVQTALAYRELGQYERALAEIDSELATTANDPGLFLVKSSILIAANRPDDALAAADRAVGIAPRDFKAHVGRATALGELGKFDEMLETLDTAAAHGAADGAFHMTRALALTELGRFEEALAAYDKAIKQAPGMAVVRHQRACLRLLLGDFEAGFAEHEWRRKIPEFGVYQRFEKAAPQWSGEDIAGKRLLLVAEQGHGDAIQFARYIPLLLERGAKVTLVVRDALASLFRSSFPDVTIIGPGEAVAGFDFQAFLMSLPLVFGVLPETIPTSVPYLATDPSLVEKWRRRIGDDGFKVGVAWSGNPKFPRDRYRSVPLVQFAPLAAVPGVRLISLQAVQGLDQLDHLPAGMSVEALGPEITDNPDGFAEIAAAMACLDLVVSSDTAVAHLAGALARPVWVALAAVPDWRWLLQRSDSLWYPTMRLFRQTSRGDWAAVFAGMAAACSDRERVGSPDR